MGMYGGPPRTSKRAQDTGGEGIPAMTPPKRSKGMVMRSGGKSTASSVSTGKQMIGSKTTKPMGSSKGITDQGSPSGMTAGRGRTNAGRKNIGSGRAQSY